MRGKRLHRRDLEALMQRSFPDDLPADVSAYLDGAFDDIKRKMAEKEGDAPRAGAVGAPSRASRSAPARTWWRPAAALASLALAVFGAGFRAADAASPWAAPFLLWQTRASLQEAIHRTASMEVIVEVSRAGGQPLQGVIRWDAPGPVVVTGGDPDPGAQRELQRLGSRLEPPSLARQLNSAWSIRPPAEGKAILRAAVRPPDGGGELLVEVDGATYLPVRIADAGGEFAADFHWTQRTREATAVLRRPGQAGR